MRLKTYFLAPAAFALGVACSAGAFANEASAAPDKRQAQVESRIRDMYATLHITQAQDAEWNAFAQVMLDNAQAMDAAVKQNGGDREKLSAPEILNDYAAIAERHAENVARLSAALEMLYADLSPQQKQVADEMFRRGPPKKASATKQ
jgi:hypothetical protein